MSFDQLLTKSAQFTMLGLLDHGETQMQTATVTFEATGTSKAFDLKAVRALADYHRGSVGHFTDRNRTEFKALAPMGEADFDYMLTKLAKLR